MLITGISSEIADNSRNVLSGGGDKELGADDEAEPAPRETVVPRLSEEGKREAGPDREKRRMKLIRSA